MAWIAVAIVALIVLPVLLSLGLNGRTDGVPWYQARRDPTGIAPDPAIAGEAVIQVYAARAVSWRRGLAVHTWIAVKPAGAARYTRFEVMGFGVAQGAPAIRIDRTGPDNYWFGARPAIVLDRRGPGADALIDAVRNAVARYPYPNAYRAWPGPNSNTFTAFVARSVPGLGLALPANAMGKDFLPGAIIARAPSGTGFQISLYGLLGLVLAVREGLEIDILGLTVGLDVTRLGLKLPGLGDVSILANPIRSDAQRE